MSKICIYIDVEPYLSQWFVHEQGGEVPVQLVRGSIESKLLELFLKQRPKDMLPERGDGKLAIAIPTFRHRPPEVYNYLTPSAKKALLKTLRNRFDLQLFADIHNFGSIGKLQEDIIYAWMEAHDIEATETNWNSIAKRYQRMRNIYLTIQRRNDKKMKKKSD